MVSLVFNININRIRSVHDKMFAIADRAGDHVTFVYVNILSQLMAAPMILKKVFDIF